MKTYTFKGVVYTLVYTRTAPHFKLKALETTITIIAKNLAQAQGVFNHYGMESLKYFKTGE